MNSKLKRFSTLVLSLFVINLTIVASFANGEEVYTNSSTVAKSRMKRYLIFQPGSRILVRKSVCKWFGRTTKVSRFWTAHSFEWTSKTTSSKLIKFLLMALAFVPTLISCNRCVPITRSESAKFMTPSRNWLISMVRWELCHRLERSW